MQNPQSRNEAILQSMIADTEYTDPPQSRIEALLLKLKEVIEAGGGEIVVDDEISTTSIHPVQNRVIAANLLPAIAGITPNSSGSMELDREDLNNFTTSGIYNAMNCENAPFNDMALVILGYSMDGYCVQIACDVASGNFKFRNQIDGNWTAWGDNILSTLEAHTAAINELENNTKSIQTVTGNHLTIEASESNLVECVAEVECVQEGSGDPSPDNIRPIIGQTEVVIEDCGKNLCKLIDGITYGKAINNGVVVDSVSGTWISELMPISDFDTLYIKVFEKSSYTNGSVVFHESVDGVNYTQIGSISNTSSISDGYSNSYAISSSAKYLRISGYMADNTASTKYIESMKLMLALSPITTYEPYAGKTYTIQLGDTIYGGELDVITGELRVTHGEVDLGDFEWEVNNTGTNAYEVYVYKDDIYFNGIDTLNSQLKCNAMPVKYPFTDVAEYSIRASIYNNIVFIAVKFPKSVVSTLADAKTFLANNNVQLIYPTEPYTIQLTPQQIRLLKGTNHLSCNTGDLSIKYYPDNVLGQLKGDIEDEYDERITTLDEKTNNALKIKSITTTTGTNQQGVSSSSYDNYVQGDKKLIPLSITAKTPGYEVVDVHYVLDEINRLIYFIPKDLTGSAIPSGRTVSMTIYYFEI